MKTRVLNFSSQTASRIAGICLLLTVCFIGAGAQPTGAITGRVVSEDGGGLANVTVLLNEVSFNQRPGMPFRRLSVGTDEEGNFRFADLPPRVYSVNVFTAKGYVRSPVPTSERNARNYQRIGDHVTITMIRGGVITGRVATAAGDPMIGVPVGVMMTKDAEGNPVRQGGGRSRMTDDRGVYRLYGLAPGTYVVYTPAGLSTGQVSPYEGYARTFHPSSPRETAAEVTVASGGEATGVDIRYRGERGHTVSGVVTGGSEPSQRRFSLSISLHSIATGYVAGTGFAQAEEEATGFAIHGVTDGEYEIIARRPSSDNDGGLASPPRRVTIRGADVGGIELKLAPLASISGRIVVEAAPNACESKRKSSVEEIIVSSRRDTKSPSTASQFSFAQSDSAVNEKGEFIINNLDPGRYFLDPRLPTENWYVKSIVHAAAPATARAGAAKPAANNDAGRNGLTLKPGDKTTGLTVTVADGAASLRGKVVAEKTGARLPERLRAHLIPAETAAADDVLRYAETLTRGDGAFALNHLAPGRYWLVARAVPDDEPSDRPVAPVAWDANERAKLRREAEAAKVEVELKPCQRVSDQVVKYGNLK